MLPRQLQVPFTKEVNWVTRSAMHSVPRLIIPTHRIVACIIGDGEAETGLFGNRMALEQIPQSP